MPKRTKSRALYILKYLWLYTDDEHPASISDLTGYLAKNGMEAHRTTVSADIAELGNIGIDIIATRKTQMWYHIGNRFFEQPELKLLTDAVSAAKFISEKKSTELIEKLSALASENQQKQLLRHLFVAGQPKTKNEKVYYIVDASNQVINEGRKLSFQYFGYLPDKTKELKHAGYVYAVSPYSLAWNGDNYYLIGYSEKHGSISNFRVDRMTNLKLMEEEAVPLPEGFSVSEYCAKLFLMVGGKEETVEILCDNAVMNNIIDRFGEQVQTEIVDNAHFKATVSVIPGSTFYAWIFNYAGKMKLLSPASVVLDFQKMLNAF